MPRKAWMLALAAVSLRALASLTVQVIDGDGARDLRMAELIEAGRYSEALTVQTPTAPLHPFLTAMGSLLTGNRLGSGVACSVILGGLALLPLYDLARRTWGERVATVSASLYLCLPAVLDSQIEPMTEGTFMFFFFWAMDAAWVALEDRSWELVVAASGCSALAWLARPEGIYLVPLFCVAAALCPSRFVPWALGIFLATWLVLAYPYLSFIHARTGRWEPSLSPIPGAIREALEGVGHSVPAAQGYDEYRIVAKYGVILGGALHLGSNLLGKVLFYFLGPFLLVGLLRPGVLPGRRRLVAWQWVAAIGYLVPVALSFAASTPFSHRFLLVPATMLLPTAAAGLVRAADRIPSRHALTAMVGALCLVMGIRDLRPRRADKLGFKEAGLAILRTLGPDARVWTTNGQVEYYARSSYVPSPEGRSFQDLERSGYDAFAVCPEELPHWEPGLEERLRATTVLFGEFPSPPRPEALPVRVYRSKPRR